MCEQRKMYSTVKGRVSASLLHQKALKTTQKVDAIPSLAPAKRCVMEVSPDLHPPCTSCASPLQDNHQLRHRHYWKSPCRQSRLMKSCLELSIVKRHAMAIFKTEKAPAFLLKIRWNSVCQTHAPICYTVFGNMKHHRGNLQHLKP